MRDAPRAYFTKQGRHDDCQGMAVSLTTPPTMPMPHDLAPDALLTMHLPAVAARADTHARGTRAHAHNTPHKPDAPRWKASVASARTIICSLLANTRTVSGSTGRSVIGP